MTFNEFSGGQPINTVPPMNMKMSDFAGGQDISLDTSAAGLSSSTRSREDLLKQFQSEADKAKSDAEDANSNINIAAETGKQSLKTLGRVGKEAIQSGIQFIGSAVRSPVDIVRGAFGYSPVNDKIDVGFGDKRGSIQSEFSENTVPDVVSGKTSPLAATAGVVGQTLDGAGNIIGAESLLKTGLEAGAKVLGRKAVEDTGAKLAGTITQGATDDISASRNALSKINPKKVRTYKDLSNALDESIRTDSKVLDKKLESTKINKPIDSWSTDVKVGDQTVKHNYVSDALDQLKTFYTKTNDVKNATRISQLIQKGEDGLSVKEVNDIAKEHGSVLNAYNANGELASGLTKQAAENTRVGLKETAREAVGDSEFKALDKSMSDKLRTKDLIDKQAEAVQKLQNKIKNRTLGEKAGRLLSQIVNTLGANAPKGAIEYFLGRGTGLKTLNALDLEKELQSNLKALQEAAKPGASEATMSKYLQSVVDSLNKRRVNIDDPIKDALKAVNDTPNKQGGFAKLPFGEAPKGVNPTSVAKKMDARDLKTAREYLMSSDPDTYISSHPMFKAMGIDNLAEKDLKRFLKEIIDIKQNE